MLDKYLAACRYLVTICMITGSNLGRTFCEKKPKNGDFKKLKEDILKSFC